MSKLQNNRQRLACVHGKRRHWAEQNSQTGCKAPNAVLSRIGKGWTQHQCDNNNLCFPCLLNRLCKDAERKDITMCCKSRPQKKSRYNKPCPYLSRLFPCFSQQYERHACPSTQRCETHDCRTPVGSRLSIFCTVWHLWRIPFGTLEQPCHTCCIWQYSCNKI